MTSLLFTLLIFISVSPRAEAASCCGGSFASPSVITGDERATMSTEFSVANVATEVSSSGIWQSRRQPETLASLRLQGAHVFRDRFQVGGSLPIIRKSRANSESSGIGDIALNLGYETLPEWEYSDWRPRGVSYITLTAPTGRSIQESTDSLQLDARGRGFWSLGLGTTLTKISGKVDLVLVTELHKSFARAVKNSTLEGELIPGFGGSASIGGGYSFNNTRIGTSLTANYEDAIETRGTIASAGSPARFATAVVAVSQMFRDDWSATLAISDQSLFGAPTNTSLAQSISISLQRRVLR